MEYVQFYRNNSASFLKNFRNHFRNFWNVNDIVYLFLNIIIIFVNVTETVSIYHQRMIASIAVISIWLKVLDWLRLFDTTAFFVALIKRTITGMTSFLIIMFVWYMTFGTAFYIVNLSRYTDDGAIIDKITGIWFLDAFASQFELG